MINCKENYLNKKKMGTYLKRLQKKGDITDFTVYTNYIKIDTKNSNWYGDYFYLFYKNDNFIGFMYDNCLSYCNRADFEELTDTLAFEVYIEHRHMHLSYKDLYEEFKSLFND